LKNANRPDVSAGPCVCFQRLNWPATPVSNDGDYAKQIVKACFLNRRDPVKQWQAVYQNAASIKRWINSMAVKYYHIESATVDLKITPGEQRRWIGISGHNIPSFELFVSPDWRGTSGEYFADQPSYRSGNLVKGSEADLQTG
jgi:aminopeptidase